MKIRYFTALMSEPGEDPKRYALTVLSGNNPHCQKHVVGFAVSTLESEAHVIEIREVRSREAERVLAHGLSQHAPAVLRELQARGWLPCRAG